MATPTEIIELLRQIDPKQWLLFALFPLFLLSAAAEAWHFRRSNVFCWRDSLASIILGAAYLSFELLFYALFVWTIFDWVYQYRLATIQIGPITGVLLYLAVDLLFYLYHLTAHKVRYFWAGHVVHHASQKLNFTTAMRQSALYPLSCVWVFFLPLTWLGFEREWVFFTLALNLAYQYFLHTQWLDKLPAPIELIFNTPSHHRAHHGCNPRYIDKNFGGTLIIWDRMFGTFVAESSEDKPQFGIVRQVHSYNPIWLTLHEWVAIGRDMAQPGEWSQRLKHLWANPEWQRSEAHNPKQQATSIDKLRYPGE